MKNEEIDTRSSEDLIRAAMLRRAAGIVGAIVAERPLITGPEIVAELRRRGEDFAR